MSLRILATGMLLSLLWVNYTQAAPMPTVRWLVQDFPPMHIISGPNRNEGLRDQFLASLWQKLRAFRHVLELSNGERQFAQMKAGEPVCSISMLKTPEREKVMLFSREPFQLQLPVRLIVDDKVAQLLQPTLSKQTHIGLREVLDTGLVRLGINPKRHYGEPLDSAIADAKARTPNKVLAFSDDSELRDLLRLLSVKRIDATLGYSVEVEYLRQQRDDIGNVSYVPLAETPALVPIYVGCSRSAVGTQVIAALDAQSMNDQATRRLHDDYVNLLPPIERKRYEAALKSH